VNCFAPPVACERRRSDRLLLPASAVILQPGYTTYVYTVTDLSLHGALLSGWRTPPGHEFDLLLRLPAGFVEVSARIARRGTNGSPWWAVAFDRTLHTNPLLLDLFER